MRILFVVEHYFPRIGGIQVVVEEIAERLVKMGHKVHVITRKLPDTKIYEEINGVMVHRVSVPKKGGRYWFDSFFSIPKILKIGKECDIIHSADYVNAFPPWFASKLLKKKCVITVHEPLGAMWKNLMGMNYFSAKLHQIFERMLISLPFDMHVCISRYTKTCLRFVGIKDEKLKVIYNGIDCNLFDPNMADGSKIRERLNLRGEFIYMSFGRPGITKGIECLINAVPLISKKNPNSKLLLILANEPKDRYEVILRMIRNSGVEGNIILLDPVSRNDLPNYIAASDCVVVPSLSEGFGFTAAEACAMKKTVVATDVASLPEVVSGRYVLVEPRNPEAIAEGVEKVYMGEIGDTGKKVFSWDECVEGYLGIYKEVTT